ncbi:HEXXH motif-containing protein [Streptacidiphilus sp. MAP12-33]|uniref:HEXXH motif domain-containing protein n=1 Tax=Streptacidiphilus sp. MAP12-33 TaxID=3156266 RepID=UPI003519AAB4
MKGVALHAIRPEAIDDLAVGRLPADLVEALRTAELSRRLISLRCIQDLARRRAPGPWRAARADLAWELFRAADQADRSALHDTLRHPPTGALLGRLLRTLNRLPDRPADEPPPDLRADLDGLLRLAVAASLRAGLPVNAELPARRGTVPLPTWGVAVLPGPTDRLRVDAGRLRLPGHPGSLGLDAEDHLPEPAHPGFTWSPVRRIDLGPSRRPDADPDSRDGAHARLSLLIEDGDPDRDVYGFAVTDRLTRDELASWAYSLGRAWKLLGTHHPARAAVCGALLHALVPLVQAGPRSSSTARELLGAVALSWTDDPLLLADSLVHEVSHLALGGLTGLVDLHDPEDEGRYQVGWRPDPRPIGAVLQGLYAHVQVVDFWQRQRGLLPPGEAARADLAYARLYPQVIGALRMLADCPALTTTGRRLCAGMADLAAEWPAPAGAIDQGTGRPPASRNVSAHPGESRTSPAKSTQAAAERVVYSGRNRSWGPSEVRTSPSWESS